MKELYKISFLDLKRNYLIFMERVLTWFDPNLVRVLFALLVSGEPLDQQQILKLTELNRATISTTLSELTNTTSKFLVIQTRKKGERKKYQCPMKLAEYLKILLIEGLEVTKYSLEQIPLLINRLEALSSKNKEVKRIKQSLEEYWEVSNFFHFAVTYFQTNIERYVSNPETLSQLKKEIPLKEIQNIDFAKYESIQTSNDTLIQIKRDFINDQATRQSAAVGKKKELVSISLLLFLEKKALSQDYIMKISGYSRSTVSVTLKTLIRLNILQVIKKTKDRKKYYQITHSLKENMVNTLNQFNAIFTQAKEIVITQFIPDEDKIKGSSNEKQQFKEFLEENIRFFQLFSEYTIACGDALQGLL